MAEDHLPTRHLKMAKNRIRRMKLMGKMKTTTSRDLVITQLCMSLERRLPQGVLAIQMSACHAHSTALHDEVAIEVRIAGSAT